MSAKSPTTTPPSTSSTRARTSSGAGRLDHSGDDLGDRHVRPAAVELDGGGLRVGVHPAAEQVEPPQRAGQRVGRGAGPQLGERLESLGVGQVDHPLDEGLVGLVAGAAHEGVAARSAASLSTAGSTSPSIASKCWAPGSRGRWWWRSVIAGTSSAHSG